MTMAIAVTVTLGAYNFMSASESASMTDFWSSIYQKGKEFAGALKSQKGANQPGFLQSLSGLTGGKQTSPSTSGGFLQNLKKLYSQAVQEGKADISDVAQEQPAGWFSSLFSGKQQQKGQGQGFMQQLKQLYGAKGADTTADVASKAVDDSAVAKYIKNAWAGFKNYLWKQFTTGTK